MSAIYCPACRTYYRREASHNCSELAAMEEEVRLLEKCLHARVRKNQEKALWHCLDCGFNFPQMPRSRAKST